MDDGVAVAGVGVWFVDRRWRVLDEWVRVGQPDEFVACGGREGFDFFTLSKFGDAFDRIHGHDGEVAINADEGVVELLVDRDREVRGECPWSGGPDHEAWGRAGMVGFSETKRVEHCSRVGCFEIDIHGEVFSVLVFELGIGERGFVGDGPVDWFECFVDESLLAETCEDFEDSRFVAWEEGEVGVFVIRDGHESFHLTGLEFDLFVGVGLALAAERGASLVVGESIEFGGFPGFDEVGHDLVLDGEAVAVPAWYVGAVVSGHELAADDEVLERFVHEVSEVDRAVGVGGAVVEDESLASLGGFLHCVVEALLVGEGVPAFERGGLVLDKVRLHGEGGLGEVEGLFVVRFGCCVGHFGYPVIHGWRR